MAKTLFQIVGIMLVVTGCGSSMTPNQVPTQSHHADAIGEEDAYDFDNYGQQASVAQNVSAPDSQFEQQIASGQFGQIQPSEPSIDHAAPSTQLAAKFDAEKLKISPNILQQALAERERTKSLIKNNKFFGITDFSLPSSEKRFWLIDAQTGKLVFRAYVSHGRGSGSRMWATKFSNAVGSNASSLGSYITTTPYRGDHGPALRLIGVSSTNSNAFKRAIVIHGAKYVPILDEVMIKIAGAGRSNGCFAFGFDKTAQVVSALNSGAFLYAGLSRQLKVPISKAPAKKPKKTKVAKR
jgi:hypothetical protein